MTRTQNSIRVKIDYMIYGFFFNVGVTTKKTQIYRMYNFKTSRRKKEN